ncbi:MAG: RHS repeat-associated core domain-containing protein [Bacteroidetes bacterium]|nr:RHS repeat-associated core domain-containing protein [Bacteroidota bacterium]
MIDAGWNVVPTGAFSQQYVSIPTVTAKEAGYVFVYLSYEDQSNNWVYFDDFKVTVTPTNILQSNEYYPFGLLTQNSWTRDNTSNSFLYDGGNELNTTTGIYETMFRGYDPALGRFHQIDPLAYRSSDLTPYHYAGNNPVNFNDPWGLLKATQQEFFDFINDALAGNGGTWSEDGGQHLFSDEEFAAMNASFGEGGGGSGSYMSSPRPCWCSSPTSQARLPQLVGRIIFEVNDFKTAPGVFDSNMFELGAHFIG